MTKHLARAGPDRVALYDALLATNPAIERKGATMPYTSVNGNMFSLLTADGTLALRLPTADREAFLKKYKTTLCQQYGAVMKEYVSVPATLLANPRQLAKYLALSYEYARSLKPKPTTKRKPAKDSTTPGRVRRAT
jgi:TfoX/Sxy family transcriptional regulator of competence genes